MFLLGSKCQSGLFCVYKKNLSPRFILQNQHFKVPQKFPMATGDAFSYVELLIGIPDESERMRSTSLLVMSRMFRHMGIPEMASATRLFETFDSSRFRRDGSCREVVFLQSTTWFLRRRAPLGELCGSPSEFTVIIDGGSPVVVLTNRSVGFRRNHGENFGAVSKCATLADRYLEGLCDSFRRAGLPVHEVTPRCSMDGVRIICYS